MNKLRGESKNWYSEPIAERQRMMREHGMIGRQYAGRVIQIISGSIGFDDWEWGVDLFADDPLVFKNSSTKCASTKPARFTVFSAPFLSGCASRRPIWLPCSKARRLTLFRLICETPVHVPEAPMENSTPLPLA